MRVLESSLCRSCLAVILGWRVEMHHFRLGKLSKPLIRTSDVCVELLGDALALEEALMA